jgi:hypothetical protein
MLGKINITGSKSFYESVYLFILVYHKYLLPMRLDTSKSLVNKKASGRGASIYHAGLVLPTITKNTDVIYDNPHQGEEDQDDDEEEEDDGDGVSLEEFVRHEDGTYTGYYRDNKCKAEYLRTIDTSGPEFRNMTLEQIDLKLMSLALNPDF